MKLLLSRLRRAVAHLRHGTLFARLGEIRQARLDRRRRATWDEHLREGRDLVEKLEPGLSITLPIKSALSELIFFNDFEWQEREFLGRCLQSADVFVDLGANIGLFTLIAGARVGRTGHVHAFEPSAITYQYLVNNVARNRLKNVSTHRLAVSNVAGEVDLTVSLDGYDAWNSLATPSAGHSFSVESVTAVTWDAFALEHDLVGRVAAMKIDVEGWERNVLAGATQTLARPDGPILQVEFTDQNCQNAGTTCKQLYEALRDLGYTMYVYDAVSGCLVRDPLRDAYPYLNLVALKHPEQLRGRVQVNSEGDRDRSWSA